MKLLVTSVALAIAGLAISSPGAYGALQTSADGDLLLGFRASGGTGASRDYVVNIGPASQFVGGSGTIAVSFPGSLGADLSSSAGALGLFGPSWNTRADVFWGIAGTDLPTDPANTLYATRPRTAPATQALPWERRANGSQSGTNSVIRSFISGFRNSDANAASPKGTIQATSFANSYASFTSAGVDFGFFSGVEGDFGAGTAASVLDLFRIAPGISGSGSQHLGHFTISSSGALSFTFDTATLPPVLNSPVTSSQNPISIPVSFTLPETAQAGSVQLAFTNGGPGSTLVLSDVNETPRSHSFTLNATNPVGTNVTSGGAITDGVYTVTLSYRDSLGNSQVSTQATSVLVDATAPILNLTGVATTGYFDDHTLPDLRPSVVVTDSTATTLEQNPPVGTVLSTGTLSVSFTATDAVGNHTTQSVVLTIDPFISVTSVLAAKGAAVPGAGVLGSGIAAGATFTALGIPSINDDGKIAYVAKWAAAKTATAPKQTGAGLFAGNPVALIAKVGDAVPSIPGATFSVFKDPVINEDGKIAVIATIKGTGVVATSNQVIITNAFSSGLSLVARKGVPSIESDSAIIRSFKEISLQGGEVLYTTNLGGGTPVVSATNDAAAFATNSSATKHVVREGQTFGSTTVRSYKLLGAVSGSANQTRAHSIGSAAFLVLLADKTQALVDGDGTTLTSFAKTNQVTGGTVLPSATFKSFGFVAADGAQEAVHATLTAKVGGVVSANAKGIFLGIGSIFEPIARLTNPTPGISGSVFSTFYDPLLVDGIVAFPAKIKNTTSKTTTSSLWWKAPSGSLTVISTLLDPVAEIPNAKWKKFSALALAGGSNPTPIFYAQLVQGVGGVTAANDYGVWALDSSGALRLIVREGDTINGKIVKTLNVLGPVSGSNGVTHSFNANGQVIYRANFADGTTAIAISTIP